MFEKDAEEILNKHCNCEFLSECIDGIRIRCFDYKENKKLLLEGIEFSYNKANEWHYNGIPHDNKPYFCKVKHPTNYDESEYEILFFDDKDMTWFRWLTLWSGEEGNETARINRKVLAWKEIVPPKEVENERY